MDGTLVYSKTPIGIAEISLRSARLPLSTRRVLIMIDGKRTVEDLSIVVKPGEIDSIITILETSGLIQKMAHYGALDVPTIYGRDDAASPALSGANTGGELDDRDANPMTLEEVKRRAVRGLAERLGPTADSLSIRIESCKTIEEFRHCVREAERYISSAMGSAAAQEYLKGLRRRG